MTRTPPASALLLRLALLAAVCAGLIAVLPAARASAATNQVSMLEDDGQLLSDPAGTVQQLRVLGVEEIRLPLRWLVVAPNAGSYRRPRHFNAADPSAHGYSWAAYDRIVQAAAQDGIMVNLDVTGGAPLWATGKGQPGVSQWEPSASEFGQFVKAVGTRYSGSYDPGLRRTVPHNSGDLPRVSSWSVWNEPDYGPSLAPQGLPGHLTVEHSPEMYRNLVDQAWNALQHTGHRHDTIFWGELAPRGRTQWGVFSGMMPLIFLRAMYCVDVNYRPLRGNAARLRGCPATAAGSRRFRADHPALFQASGVSDHPYMRWYPPNDEVSPDPAYHNPITDYTSLGVIGKLERGLDRLQRVYGSHRQLPIFDTEFGYITSPPKRRNAQDTYPWVSPTTSAVYLNWAEYIHWRDPRLVSFEQYLLHDPEAALKSNDYGGFASGLLSYGGTKKPAYYAWRLPLFLPVTSTRRGNSLEVWGCVRPSHFAIIEGQGPQTVLIQVGPGTNPSNSAFTTVDTATISDPNSCYFDRKVKFSGSGTETVRLVWNYPSSDPFGYFDPLSPGAAVYSRHVQINLH